MICNCFNRLNFNNNFTYLFSKPADYKISLIVKTNSGCRDTAKTLFHLRPFIKLREAGYFEDFNYSHGGWYNNVNELKSDASKSIWQLGVSDNSSFPKGGKYWYTYNPADTALLPGLKYYPSRSAALL